MICSVLNRLRGILPPGRDARILTLGLERSQGVRSVGPDHRRPYVAAERQRALADEVQTQTVGRVSLHPILDAADESAQRGARPLTP